MTRMIWATAATIALLGAGQAIAFQTPADATPAAKVVPAEKLTPAETKAPRGTKPEEISNTARLNAEQAKRARQDNVTYEQEVSAAQQQVAHDQTTFAEETAVYEAEKARVAAMSAAERMKWEADAAACKAGDLTRCAQPAPQQPK